MHIPLAGNAWVLDDPLASSALIRETGLTDWPDPAHSTGVFFHLAGTDISDWSRQAGSLVKLRFTEHVKNPA